MALCFIQVTVGLPVRNILMMAVFMPPTRGMSEIGRIRGSGYCLDGVASARDIKHMAVHFRENSHCRSEKLIGDWL